MAAQTPIKTPLIPIPDEKLETMLNRPIHLQWANPGCVWILREINGEKIRLETPKTKKVIWAKVKDACYVRRLEPPKPTTVRVFHNRNNQLRVAGDPDHCANLALVATVTVPEGEKPLNAAFQLTNHIDTDWTKNPEVVAEPGEYRSSSVGDVFEVCEPDKPPVRYVIEDKGFSQV